MGQVLPGPGSWAVDTETYTEAEFYFRSTDEKGHYQSSRVKMPPRSHGQISALVANPRYPYRTHGDFIRDAITHRLHYLQTVALGGDGDQLKETVQYLTTSDSIKAKVAFINETKDTLLELQHLGDAAYTERDFQMLESAIAQAQELADTTREPYATHFRNLADHLEMRYRSL